MKPKVVPCFVVGPLGNSFRENVAKKKNDVNYPEFSHRTAVVGSNKLLSVVKRERNKSKLRFHCNSFSGAAIKTTQSNKKHRKSSVSSLPCVCCDNSYVFDYSEHVLVELRHLQVVSAGSHVLLILTPSQEDNNNVKYKQRAIDYERSLECSRQNSVQAEKPDWTNSNATFSSSFIRSSSSSSERVIPVFIPVPQGAELIETIARGSSASTVNSLWYGFGANTFFNFARLLYFIRKTMEMFTLIQNLAKVSNPKNIMKPIAALLEKIWKHRQYSNFQTCFYEWLVDDMGFEVIQVVLESLTENATDTNNLSGHQSPNATSKVSRQALAGCRLPVEHSNEWVRARLCLAKSDRQFFINLHPWDALGLGVLKSLRIPIYIHASLWICGSTGKNYISCNGSLVPIPPANGNNFGKSSKPSSLKDEDWISSKVEETGSLSAPFGSSSSDSSSYEGLQKQPIPFFSSDIHRIVPFRRPSERMKPLKFIPFTQDIRDSLRNMLIQGQFTEARQLIAQIPSLQWELEILDALRKEDYLTATRLKTKLKTVLQLEKVLLRERDDNDSDSSSSSSKKTVEQEEEIEDDKDTNSPPDRV
eukprot:jgi/Galph1/4267/GphlegSOOS_G2895.1